MLLYIGGVKMKEKKNIIYIAIILAIILIAFLIIININNKKTGSLISLTYQQLQEKIDKKDDFIKLAVEEGCGAYYIQNNSVNYDVNLDKVTIKSFENIDEDTLIFYTTETIDDLLNSYKKHSEIDLREVQGPVLKKTKKTNI